MQKSRDEAGNRITQAYQAAMPQPSNLTNAPIITTNTTYTYLQVGTDNFLASANLTTGWWKTGSNKLQEVTETSKFNYDDQARRQLEDRYDQYYYDSNSAHTNYGNVSGNYSGSSYSQSETAAVKLYDGEGAVRAYQGVYNTLGGNTGNLSTVSEDWVRGSDWGGGIGGILYSQALSGNANTAKYYHYDGRGDVVALTSNTGAVTYQAAYDAYGTHGNVSTKGTEESGTDTDPFRTNTREEWLSADGTTFVNERHRPRDLLTDVYFTRDPLGQAAGPNPYTYVEQDEWTKTDPEGLQGPVEVAGEGEGDEDEGGEAPPPRNGGPPGRVEMGPPGFSSRPFFASPKAPENMEEISNWIKSNAPGGGVGSASPTTGASAAPLPENPLLPKSTLSPTGDIGGPGPVTKQPQAPDESFDMSGMNKAVGIEPTPSGSAKDVKPPAAQGSNNPATNQAAIIGQEAHRQLEADGEASGTWKKEQTITLPNGQTVRKDGVSTTDPNSVRIIKPNTPTGRAAADKRAGLMQQNGYKPTVDLYDPSDPAFLPGSPTYIGPKN
jgi:hypothetical protein